MSYHDKGCSGFVILPEKMRLSYRVRQALAGGQASSDKVNQKELVIAVCKLLLSSLYYGMVFPVIIVWRDRAAFPFWQNYLYERAIPRIFYHIGTLVKYFRDRFSQA